jgi:hypothetical protein
MHILDIQELGVCRHIACDVTTRRQRPVNSYTITITADNDSTTTTTLRLDMSGSDVRLTDLHLHAGGGLSTGQLPAIDYGLLLRAITSTTPTPITAASTAPAVEIHTGEVHTEPAIRSVSEPMAAAGDTAQQPASPVTRRPRKAAPAAVRPTRTGRRAPSKSTPAPAEPATSSRTRRAAANKTTPPAAKKTARTARKPIEATPAKKTTRAAAGGRAYRRMPDDFATVYRQAGSPAAVADHYQVPRHTANGWIRRLRDQATTPTGR